MLWKGDQKGAHVGKNREREDNREKCGRERSEYVDRWYQTQINGKETRWKKKRNRQKEKFSQKRTTLLTFGTSGCKKMIQFQKSKSHGVVAEM